MSDQVVVRRFSYRHEAEVARSFLDGHGIEARVTSDDCGAVDPALGLVRGACLVVAADNAARAEELLDAPTEPPAGLLSSP
jgi:prophage DNA circulation protein